MSSSGRIAALCFFAGLAAIGDDTLAVSNAVPREADAHAVALSRIDLSLFGGVLVPSPQVPIAFVSDTAVRPAAP